MFTRTYQPPEVNRTLIHVSPLIYPLAKNKQYRTWAKHGCGDLKLWWKPPAVLGSQRLAENRERGYAWGLELEPFELQKLTGWSPCFLTILFLIGFPAEIAERVELRKVPEDQRKRCEGW